MAYLALVRHGQSEWNAKNLWTGWTDIPLSEQGRQEARDAAQKLTDIHWDIIFEAELVRAMQTTEEIVKVLGLSAVPIVSSPALNERNYGELTGKNKLEVEKQLGEEEFKQIRRGWDVPIAGGESLKDVYSRVVPYYQKEILPKIQEGKNVLVSAHGNSIRALAKFLENISDKDISQVELETGAVYLYTMDANGKVVGKEIRNARGGAV